MKEIFGKSSKQLLTHKNRLFSDNDILLEQQIKTNSIYISQPTRSKCKNCDSKFSGSPEYGFTKTLVSYVVCEICGHLNGMHEDTDEFCQAVYTEDAGRQYASNYSVGDYQEYMKRVQDIYEPKSEFLLKSLEESAESPSRMKFADFGAGAGYFISALTKEGISNAVGYEVSDSQIELGEAMIGPGKLYQLELDEITSLAADIDVDAVSMIGVLEHLQAPRKMMDSLCSNAHVSYVFLSLPTFSPCIFLEMAFPNVMPRQLSGGHTHLYTESSLEWFEKEYGLTPLAKWWFGTDVVDLYRNIYVSIQSDPNVAEMSNLWKSMFQPVIDELQLVLDKKHLSSEVHVLYRLPK